MALSHTKLNLCFLIMSIRRSCDRHVTWPHCVCVCVSFMAFKPFLFLVWGLLNSNFPAASYLKTFVKLKSKKIFLSVSLTLSSWNSSGPKHGITKDTLGKKNIINSHLKSLSVLSLFCYRKISDSHLLNIYSCHYTTVQAFLNSYYYILTIRLVSDFAWSSLITIITSPGLTSTPRTFNLLKHLLSAEMDDTHTLPVLPLHRWLSGNSKEASET